VGAYPDLMRTSPWPGPSGEAFARMVAHRLRAFPGVTTQVHQVDPAVSTPASFLVHVDWPEGRGVLCEVADSIDAVQVMDDDGEDVDIESALRYNQARVAGASPQDAWRKAGY